MAFIEILLVDLKAYYCLSLFPLNIIHTLVRDTDIFGPSHAGSEKAFPGPVRFHDMLSADLAAASFQDRPRSIQLTNRPKQPGPNDWPVLQRRLHVKTTEANPSG
jgi:hypothetical protein